MDEWVGIDGWPGTSGAGDLIQAGIMESMVPCEGDSDNPNNPAYNPDEFYICPWTIFIENGQATEGPIPNLTVNGGDSVTVTIWQQSGTDWAISLTDVTTGETWSIGSQYYAGPGSSAEWVVEAPGIVGSPCGSIVNREYGQCPIAPYSPDVTFSDLGLTGSLGTWYALTLVQGGAQMSTPSALSVSGTTVTGFTVSYTGTEESARAGADRRMGHPVKTLATPIFASRVKGQSSMDPADSLAIPAHH
jgi:hypothetical protein